MAFLSRVSRSAPAASLANIFAGLLAGAALVWLYARGGNGWPLGFVMFAPWLWVLNLSGLTLARTLLCAYAITVAFTAAAFAWFGIAFGAYTGVGAAAGLFALLLAAPLLQPQIIIFALTRRFARRRYGVLPGALASACAWLAAEWCLPKFLGDTLGYGLYPSRLIRQAADIGGAPGLTLLLLLSNECAAAALTRCEDGKRAFFRAATPPLLAALLLFALPAGYGLAVLSGASPMPHKIPDKMPTAPHAKPLRIGLIQANITDYERRRREQGAFQVARDILDTHFAMSYDAVVRQHADAVLWSETIYPTTFAHPKSPAGAELDQEIFSIVNAANVPFIFGTYDRDAAGEYNAAAFVLPNAGLLGFYRKTRLFPFTEYLPPWLDSARLRQWLPWTGAWLPGNGARVFPLRLSDGREIPVLPLICFDAVDANLALDGARLGAQAILTMSNDAWFTDTPQGAALHQAVAAFRSIETRLPQFRVTTNGHSAIIDAGGAALAESRIGERTLVIGDVPVRAPPRTLMVIWGDWVGRAAAVLLAIIAIAECGALPLFMRNRRSDAATAPNALTARSSARSSAHSSAHLPAQFAVAVLPPAARLIAALLRAFARGSLLWLGVILLTNDALRANTPAQIRLFAGLFLAPEAAAWCVLFAFAAKASLDRQTLTLSRGAQSLPLALASLAAIKAWRLPLPVPGVSLWPAAAAGGDSRGRPYHLALLPAVTGRADSNRLFNLPIFMQALTAAGDPALTSAAAPQAGASLLQYIPQSIRRYIQDYLQARPAARPSLLDLPLLKFILLPLALALPAFYLHQNILYGSALGEYLALGLKAYLTSFAKWWAAWIISVSVCGAALRALIEIATLLTVIIRPEQAAALRIRFEALGNALLYLGLPGWLLLRIYGA